VGKWAESPQTRINTGFLLVKSGFLKVGKTGQMARKLPKIPIFDTLSNAIFPLWSKISGLWSNPKTQK